MFYRNLVLIVCLAFTHLTRYIKILQIIKIVLIPCCSIQYFTIVSQEQVTINLSSTVFFVTRHFVVFPRTELHRCCRYLSSVAEIFIFNYFMIYGRFKSDYFRACLNLTSWYPPVAY